jgi:hypothetical protein
MAIKYNYILTLAIAAMLLSCKKDNYKPPATTLSGKVVYKGEALQLENNQVPYQLYQDGFGKVGAITQTFEQDGSYSSLLFDGQYKLIIPNGQGPFIWKQNAAGDPDTLIVNLKGNQTLDLEVMPYYLIRTPQLAAASGKVTGSFKIEKIITDANAKDIENVKLYINKTQFVSEGDNNIASTSLDGSAIVDVNNVSLSVAIPAIVPTQNYVYARIGLKISGVEDRIFSPVQKITF